MRLTALRGAGAGLPFATAVHAREAASCQAFAAGHAEPRVAAFDLGATDARGTFETAGQAKLNPVAGGAVVAAGRSDADHPRFIASGVALEVHDDHADIAPSDPVAFEEPLAGARPLHVVDRDGETAISLDGGGRAILLANAGLRNSRPQATDFPRLRGRQPFNLMTFDGSGESH